MFVVVGANLACHGKVVQPTADTLALMFGISGCSLFLNSTSWFHIAELEQNRTDPCTL